MGGSRRQRRLGSVSLCCGMPSLIARGFALAKNSWSSSSQSLLSVRTNCDCALAAPRLPAALPLHWELVLRGSVALRVVVVVVVVVSSASISHDADVQVGVELR